MAEGLNSRRRYGRSALGEVSSANIVAADPVVTGVAGGTVEAQLARLQLNKGPILPIGSVYINTSSASDPATLLGYGIWTSLGQHAL